MNGLGDRPTLPQADDVRPVEADATARNGRVLALEDLDRGPSPDQSGHGGHAETGRVMRSADGSARNDSPADLAPRSGIPNAQGGRPSATRSASARRVRLVQEARRGRPSAMHHGIYARVANLPDVATEVALQMALRPALDGLRDRRLVESWAMASVQLRRAHEAIEVEGLTEHLGSFVGRQGPLVERLERSIHERERERQAGKTAGVDPLAAYRSEKGS